MKIYRDFVGLSGADIIPDRVSIVCFRHLLEQHDLSARILQMINDKLSSLGLILKTVSVVDVMLIEASNSSKSKDGKRDREMHQLKKGNQWHFGIKAQIGVDADVGLVHTVIGTAATVHDVTQGHSLLLGEKTMVFAEAGYQVATKRPEATCVF